MTDMTELAAFQENPQDTLRDAFFHELYEIARLDRGVVLISADCGAPSLDRWRANLPEQFVNVGIAEQNMIGIAAGLALEGKKSYCYAIAPFATLRCLEQIRVDLCMMNLPVTIVGVGAGYSYGLSGPTHHALEDISVMRALPNMEILCPSDNEMATAFARSFPTGPRYIRLDRGKLPRLYEKGTSFTQGLCILKHGTDPVLISIGYMVHRALRVAKRFVNAKVVDLYQLSPAPVPALTEILKGGGRIVTIEEHFGVGGINSILAEVSAYHTSIHLPHIYSFAYGGREELHQMFGLDEASIVQRIIDAREEFKHGISDS